MFGKNTVMKKDNTEDSLLVHSIFGTIQGEGPLVGTPAIFVRLAGCPLACYFCDTDFTTGAERVTNEALLRSIKEVQGGVNAGWVVITGGEPLRQNITSLVDLLLADGFKVQIETSGVVWPEGLELLFRENEDLLTLVCSPKTPKVHEMVAKYCQHWKYIVRSHEVSQNGLPETSTQREGALSKIYRPWPVCRRNKIYIQPCEEYHKDGTQNVTATSRNMQHAAKISMMYGYQLSIQIHKILNLP